MTLAEIKKEAQLKIDRASFAAGAFMKPEKWAEHHQQTIDLCDALTLAIICLSADAAYSGMVGRIKKIAGVDE